MVAVQNRTVSEYGPCVAKMGKALLGGIALARFLQWICCAVER
jgi:hypothetical protein